MLRVTTLYASTAAVTAGYYTAYLTEAEGEIPGKWTGKQAALHGLAAKVQVNVLADAIRTRTPDLIITRQQTRTIEENSLDLGIGW